MRGQQYYGWYVGSEDVVEQKWDVQVSPAADLVAEVALTRLNDISVGDGVLGRIAIEKMISSSGTESFAPVMRQAVYRQGVTLVRVNIFVENSFARGRMLLNYW